MVAVTVKDLTDWNNGLLRVDFYDLGTTEWSDFYSSPKSDWYPALAGSRYHDSATRSQWLTFNVATGRIQGKFEIGFSFRAYPEVLGGFLATNEIILNTPTLRIVYR